MSDLAPLLRGCLARGGDAEPWAIVADAYEDAGRSDAAHALRALGPGLAALHQHLPHVWQSFVHELTRRGELTWERVVSEAGEALACAARAAGSRRLPQPAEPPVRWK